MTKALSPQVSQARKAIQEMPEPLLAVYQKLAERLAGISRLDVLTRYDIGTDLKTVIAPEEKSSVSKYGLGAAKKLAAALGLSDSTLYYFKDMALTWSREEVEGLLELRNSAGTGLSFGHLAALTILNKASERTKLLAKWRRDCLSVKDMEAAVRQTMGPRQGDKTLKPKSMNAGVMSMGKLLNNLQEAHENLAEALFKQLETDNADQHISPELVQKMQDLETDVVVATKILSEDRNRLAAAIQMCEQRLLKKSAEQQDAMIETRSQQPVRPTTPAVRPARGRRRVVASA